MWLFVYIDIWMNKNSNEFQRDGDYKSMGNDYDTFTIDSFDYVYRIFKLWRLWFIYSMGKVICFF